jgi:hypothetical protein
MLAEYGILFCAIIHMYIQWSSVNWYTLGLECFVPKYTKLHIKVEKGMQYVHNKKIIFPFVE